MLLILIDSNNNVTLNLNGNTISTYTHNYFSSGGAPYFIQGGGNTSSFTSTTYISEIVNFNTALSVLNYQKVEGYLAWKWGLQSSTIKTGLPSGHPYYNAAP